MTAGASGRDRPVPLQPAAPPPEATSGDGSGLAEDRGPLRATTVLADRMAAALVHREPGWRLPRRTALARRYNVSLTEIDAALGDLARRSLVRRLPDGQLYRASPADYWIPVEGAAGLGTRLDPMGGAITCQARHVSRREAPQDVAWALRLPSGAPIRVVRCVWACAGDPAAVSTAYLNEPPGDGDAEPGHEEDQPVPSLDSVLNALPAAAVSVEMSPPQPSIARSLRLSPGQPVITVTARFDDAVTGAPAGLTVVVLRPELFRVAVDTTEAPAGRPLAARGQVRRPARGRIGSALALWVAAAGAIVGGRSLLKIIPMAWLTRGTALIMLALAAFSTVTVLRLSRLSRRATALSWRSQARQPGHARGGPGTLGAETPAGRYRGGIDATACPISRPQGTSPS